MRDRDGAISDPLARRIFLVFDVAIAFGGHVMTPLYAGIIVVKKRGGRFAVGDGVAKVGKAGDHVAYVDREAGAHVGSSNLGIARAEGCSFLPFGFPRDRTAGTHDDGAAHTSELE